MRGFRKAIRVRITLSQITMKNNFYLFAIVMTLATVALTSCDSSEDIVSKSVQDLPNAELTRLYNSIDSLHNEYSTMDVARGAILNKWGRRFLVATFDACVGVITSETGPGAFVCSTIASGLYDDYLDVVDRRFNRAYNFNTVSISITPQSVVFPSDNPCFVDSIGYYHNLVINEIQSKGQSFIDENGNIDYNSYYNEVLKVSKEKGIQCNAVINIPLVFRYINSIIKPFAQIEKGDEETIISIIFNGTYSDFNFDNSKTLQLRNVCEKIIYNDLSVDEDRVVEYGAKVNDLIVKSDVANDTKEMMKVANNIAINSSLYWSSN